MSEDLSALRADVADAEAKHLAAVRDMDRARAHANETGKRERDLRYALLLALRAAGLDKAA